MVPCSAPAAVALSPEQIKHAAIPEDASGSISRLVAVVLAAALLGGAVTAIMLASRAVAGAQDAARLRHRQRPEMAPYAYAASDGSRFELALAQIGHRRLAELVDA